jgi:hypothetical protein
MFKFTDATSTILNIEEELRKEDERTEKLTAVA